jgi:hypothetical protein
VYGGAWYEDTWCDDIEDSDDDGSDDGASDLCMAGMVLDCSGECNSESWIGDGWCDSPAFFTSGGADFYCAEWDWDLGDCDGEGFGDGGSTDDGAADDGAADDGSADDGGEECMDTDYGATDSYGDTCASWYDSAPDTCGTTWDDDDFVSMTMCCACGGGSTGG